MQSVQYPTVLCAHNQERGVVHVIVDTLIFCRTTLDNVVSSEVMMLVHNQLSACA